MDYKKKYLKYKKKYLTLKKKYILGGSFVEVRKISITEDFATNLLIAQNYETQRVYNRDSQNLTNIDYLEYILSYTNLPDSAEFIETLRGSEFEEFFSSILKGFYTIHSHGTMCEELIKSENILPPNVSLINTVESGRKNNLKIYKLFEDIKYHAFDFKNQGKIYKYEHTCEKDTVHLNIYTPRSKYNDMYLTNVLTIGNADVYYMGKRYSSHVIPGVFSMYNFLELNKPIDKKTVVLNIYDIFSSYYVDIFNIPLEQDKREEYFKDEDRKKRYEKAINCINRQFQNMSSVLSNGINHKQIKLSEVIEELSENGGGILVVNSCRSIKQCNSEEKEELLDISQENIISLNEKVNSCENTIIKEFTNNEEFWHLLWIMSLLNANKKALDSPELVCLEEYGIFPGIDYSYEEKKKCTVQ